jgi:A/G-specific adenine glycosylase
MAIPEHDAATFRKAVLDFHRREGRDFSWRRTRDPWAILVSEVMLQQTQTNRVEPRYDSWMAVFPDASSVARCSISGLYDAWRGLGYNSRALRLREAARTCCERHGGIPPADEALLLELPGVGRYTARAVMAFAWGIPSSFLETNIRSALIFHFFRGIEKVRDRDLESVAGQVLDKSDPRTWYYALMDYGAWLKQREPNPARKAAAYTRQSSFKGSVRQARGAVLRALGERGSVGLACMAAESGIEYSRLLAAAEGLERDGLIELSDDRARFAR